VTVLGDEKLIGYGEGFYGRPHTWEDRHHIIEVLASEGLNAYVYAPKNDPFHRDRWRDPYPAEELEHFRRASEMAQAAGVSFCFCIAPLGMTFSSEEEFETLVEKVRPFSEMGLRDMAVLFDDVPEELSPADRGAFRTLGQAHGVITARLFEKLSADGVRLAVAPTEYTGLHRSPYLDDLASELPAEVVIAWTGRYVLSPSITAEDVKERSSSLGHPILVWDNFPVNDGPMGIWCHLGPWMGRDWRLLEAAAGLFLNGMEQARASMVGLRQLGELVRRRETFDPMQAWKRACSETGTGAEDAFFVIAEQMADSMCHPTPSPTLSAILDEVEAASTEELPGLRRRVVEDLERQSKALSEVRKSLRDKLLLEELAPWLEEMGRNLTAMTTLARAWDLARPEESHGVLSSSEMFGIIAGILTRTQPGGTGKAVHGAASGFRAVVATVDGGWQISPEAFVHGQSVVDRLFRVVMDRICSEGAQDEVGAGD
jgi:hyaluronoglucosaminidase